MDRRDRNWTVVQMLYRDPCPAGETTPAGWKHRQEMFLVETPYKSEAKRRVASWLSRGGTAEYGEPHDIHYYPRNYVDQRDDLIAAGRVIGWDPLESTCRHASLSIL